MHNFIIIGCGAIGTSIAKAIKSCITQSVVYGFDINSDLLKILKNKKIIDHILDKNHFVTPLITAFLYQVMKFL